MSITSYTTLLSALASWNNRSDLTARYPEFIALAEAHFNREILNPLGEAVATQSVSTETVALPADFVQAKHVFLDTDPNATLTAMSIAALRDTYTWSGKPVAYALSAGDIVLGPSPDTAYTVSLTYVAKLTGLSPANETNWLLLAHPDLYLRAVRYYSLEYLKNYEAAERELAAVGGIIDSINRAANRARLPAGPLCAQPTVRE
jgi:hypothetical protein